jgi:nitric oxide reductase subunit B
VFGFNFLFTIMGRDKNRPVYIWFWATGIFYFMFTFLESYLWLIPWFRNDIVRELTMQWKSYGALVGSWNMLVYGTDIFLMEAISGEKKIAKSNLAYFMYLLGLVNLMFGWAHHIYIVPSQPWIRILAYGISMTELLILGKIIWNWKKSIQESLPNLHKLPFRFLYASDLWIFINLGLALLISIPAINLFSHGTHITVAHAMGSTIGINTMILMASIMFMLGSKIYYLEQYKRVITRGLILANISLLVFFLCLVMAGIIKGTMIVGEGASFQEAMQKAMPWLYVFAVSGVGIFSCFLMVIIPALQVFLKPAMVFIPGKVSV